MELSTFFGCFAHFCATCRVKFKHVHFGTELRSLTRRNIIAKLAFAATAMDPVMASPECTKSLVILACLPQSSIPSLLLASGGESGLLSDGLGRFRTDVAEFVLHLALRSFGRSLRRWQIPWSPGTPGRGST